MSVEPWSASAFEMKYRAESDPWDFAGSPYEQARYDSLLESLPRGHFGRAYEPGCSVGALTERLAARCDEVLAVDVSPTAVERARARCAPYPHVEVTVGSVTDAPPAGLDLLVFSEIGYYFEVEELDLIIRRVADQVQPGGDLAACHWLGHSPDHRLHGSVVHQRLHEMLTPSFAPVHHRDATGYVIDVWHRS